MFKKEAELMFELLNCQRQLRQYHSYCDYSVSYSSGMSALFIEIDKCLRLRDFLTTEFKFTYISSSLKDSVFLLLFF